MDPATTLLTPVEEYLSTSYTPDVDYLDGRLEERNVGTKAHGKMSKVVILAKEYLAMGVPVVWVIDPAGRQAFTVTPATGFYENTEGSLSAGEVHLMLTEIFEG